MQSENALILRKVSLNTVNVKRILKCHEAKVYIQFAVAENMSFFSSYITLTLTPNTFMHKTLLMKICGSISGQTLCRMNK
jgi:hypothetical protein